MRMAAQNKAKAFFSLLKHVPLFFHLDIKIPLNPS